MPPKNKPEHPLLQALENLYAVHRKKVTPLYPYDPQTNTIHLPPTEVDRLRKLLRKGDKVEAVKIVSQLTGAGLRVSKDYVDALLINLTDQKP
jgi:ribosomal protein L7/L12